MAQKTFDPKAVEAYAKLVLLVETIDKETATYLKTSALELKKFCLEDSLRSCFVWNDTPQGYEYWYAINKQVELLRRLT